MMKPPQYGVFSSGDTRPTCQGYSFALVSSPPTILLSWARPQLHVSEILSGFVGVVISVTANDDVAAVLMPFVMPENVLFFIKFLSTFI